MSVRAAAHSEAAHVPGGGVVRDLVFGANDGLVAAFAVVTGLHGATGATHVVFAGGLAELLGGTIAMSLGAYLATKSAREYYLAEHAREEHEVEHFPDEERREVREAFAREGFEGPLLDRVVEHVTADRHRWVKTMMDRELGLAPITADAARRAGLATGAAYAVGAAMPTLPYALFSAALAFPMSIAFTALTLFIVGAAKTRVTGASWWKSGLESLGIGVGGARARGGDRRVLAAAATFVAGSLLAAG